MKNNILDLRFGGDHDMYIILIYDIIMDKKGAKILRNVFKICKKYLTHIQKSVFEGNLTDLEYMKLKYELNEYIRKDKDSLIVFKSRNDKWLDKEFLGIVDDKTSNFFSFNFCRYAVVHKPMEIDNFDDYNIFKLQFLYF